MQQLGYAKEVEIMHPVETAVFQHCLQSLLSIFSHEGSWNIINDTRLHCLACVSETIYFSVTHISCTLVAPDHVSSCACVTNSYILLMHYCQSVTTFPLE